MYFSKYILSEIVIDMESKSLFHFESVYTIIIMSPYVQKFFRLAHKRNKLASRHTLLSQLSKDG